MTNKWEDKAIRKFLSRNQFDPKYLFSKEAVDVFKPDWSVLLVLRPGVVPAALIRAMFPALRRFVRQTTRRTVAQGNANELFSATLGYLKGKMTYATEQHPQEWQIIQPLLRCLNRAMRDNCLDEYAFLKAAAVRTPTNLLIPYTVFTSCTVNYWTPRHNAHMATHKDSGNLKGGYCVMTVLRSGEYSGGLLVFPKYRAAVDLHEGDCLICDNGEAHGNTDIIGEGNWERLSIVCYVND